MSTRLPLTIVADRGPQTNLANTQGKDEIGEPFILTLQPKPLKKCQNNHNNATIVAVIKAEKRPTLTRVPLYPLDRTKEKPVRCTIVVQSTGPSTLTLKDPLTDPHN